MHPLLIDFGGGSSSCSSCCCSCFSSCCCFCFCDRGKTKSIPSPKTEVWTLDWSFTIIANTDLESTEKDIWSHSSDPLIYSPGPPLAPAEIRKMSLFSNLSITIPLGQEFKVQAISPSGCKISSEHILTPGEHRNHTPYLWKREKERERERWYGKNQY